MGHRTKRQQVTQVTDGGGTRAKHRLYRRFAVATLSLPDPFLCAAAIPDGICKARRRGAEQFKRFDQIRLARPVRADQHVQTAQFDGVAIRRKREKAGKTKTIDAQRIHLGFPD